MIWSNASWADPAVVTDFLPLLPAVVTAAFLAAAAYSLLFRIKGNEN